MTIFGVEIGRPQIYGVLLLLALAWIAVREAYKTPLSPDEMRVIERSTRGTSVLSAPGSQQDPVSDSILLYRVTPLALRSWQRLQPDAFSGLHPPAFLPMLFRLPFLVFGLWLGGALWWVSRRLFNNEGGYVALALFCLSPLVVQASSTVNAEIIAAWGLFGIVYTAIGVGHTLYSPARRWPPRIALLGLAFGFTAAAHIGAALLGIGLAVFFLLYLSPPDRKLAALGVLAAALGIACAFLWACYGWQSSYMALFVQARETLRLTWPRIDLFRPWLRFVDLPTVALLVLALVAFIGWRRTRYFGNWTPLVVIAVLGLMQFSQTAPAIWIAPFVYVFVGGIAADLLESKYRRWTQIALVGSIAAQAVLASIDLFPPR